jgi:hypothetical protein
MKKRKTTQRDKGTKGQREPQCGVFPFFASLILCPFVLKKLSSPHSINPYTDESRPKFKYTTSYVGQSQTSSNLGFGWNVD